MSAVSKRPGRRPPPGRSDQHGPIGREKSQGLQEELKRVIAGESVGTAFQTADAPGADAGSFGECLLGQPCRDPLPP